MRLAVGSHGSRGAFTLVEIAIAIVIMGIVAAMALPRYADETRRLREVNAANAIAADFELAGSIAAERRVPVRLRWLPNRAAYEIALRDSNQVFLTRTLGSASDWRLENVTFAPAQVDFFPGGILSSSMRVAFDVGARHGRVSITRAGLVRVIP